MSGPFDPSPVAPGPAWGPLDLNVDSARTHFEVIKSRIMEYRASLDPEHDVALYLANFGQALLMEVVSIGYEAPASMIFTGYVNGRLSELIQHISQISFLLTSVPKKPDAPRRAIGFTAPWEEQ